MPRHIDTTLINDPFEDPGLYVNLVFERRALLFDFGDLSRLAPRKLLRVSNVFVTHRHMDHFAGFDQFLGLLLGQEKTVRIYGPRGLIDAVEHKLKACSWIRIESYEGDLVIRATEIDTVGRLTSAQYSGRNRFERFAGEKRLSDEGLLLQDPGLQVRSAILDHGAAVLGFVLEERAHINIWRNKVNALGLSAFKAGSRFHKRMKKPLRPFSISIASLPIIENGSVRARVIAGSAFGMRSSPKNVTRAGRIALTVIRSP